jgi:hypothetical protein
VLSTAPGPCTLMFVLTKLERLHKLHALLKNNRKNRRLVHSVRRANNINVIISVGRSPRI